MSDRLGMLSAIHDLPDDDLPRLAYADWMEEHGQAERAEFIRLHLTMERTPKSTPEYRRLWDRELELIARFKDDWFGTFRREWAFYEVRRGFLDEVMSTAEYVVPHANWLLENHAVQRLCVGFVSMASIPELLSSPLVATLRQLRCFALRPGGNPYHSETLPPLPGANLPLAARPLDVSFTGFSAGSALIDMLSGSPHLSRLERLNLSGNQLGEEGTRRLLDVMVGWPRLSWLTTGGRRNLNQVGIVALAGHRVASQLRVLNISGEPLDDATCMALASSRHLSRIRELHLARLPEEMDRSRQRLNRRFGDRLRWNPSGETGGH